MQFILNFVHRDKVNMVDHCFPSKDCAEHIEKEFLGYFERFEDNDEMIVKYYYESTLPFTIMRALIAEGKIDHNSAKFLHGDQDFSPNEFGGVCNFPEEFDTELNYSERIIRGSTSKRKAYVSQK